MAHGDGSIYKYRSGFTGQYYTGGKAKHVYGKTRPEVKAKLRDAILAAEQGRQLTRGDQSLSTFLAWWLRNVKASQVSTPTAVKYSFLVDMIPPDIAGMKIKAIKPDHIAMLVTALRANHAASTAACVRRLVKAALRYAVESDMLLRNPADVGHGPQVERIPKDLPAWEDLVRFVGATKDRGDRWYPLWALLLFTGMRIGEAFALEWGDIDATTGLIHITKGVKYDGQTCWVGQPKTRAARRDLELVPVVRDALATRKVAQKKERLRAKSWEDSERIFTQKRGGLLIPTSANHALVVACRAEGMTRMSPHWFRHAFVTRGAELGIPIGAMQRLAGHSTSTITQEYYTHTRQEWERDAMRKIGGQT